ncbi:MAG: AAA family ATPase, partial [Candidatus Nezhaarchaeales archaeon]
MSGSGDSVAEGKAENLPPTVLDSLRVVGFEEEFNQVLSDVMRVDYVKLPIHRAVYVEGYYGSGKTYFLRKLAHEATKLPNTIPIYFYLGSDALLFEALSRYVNEVREYVRSGKASIHVVGFPGAWAGKVSVLERCLNECAVLVVDEVDKFLAVMSCLEKNGYRPLVVFDEIERVIFGDALKDERTFEAFVPFFTRFIELIRPSRFHGVVVIATTYSVDSLIDKALWEAGRE